MSHVHVCVIEFGALGKAAGAGEALTLGEGRGSGWAAWAL